MASKDASVLRVEITVLLVKDAIELVPPANMKSISVQSPPLRAVPVALGPLWGPAAQAPQPSVASGQLAKAWQSDVAEASNARSSTCVYAQKVSFCARLGAHVL